MKNTYYVTRKETEQNMPSSTQKDSLPSPPEHLPSLLSLADDKESENCNINVGNGTKNNVNKNLTSYGLTNQQGIYRLKNKLIWCMV